MTHADGPGRTVLFVAAEFPPIKTIGRLRSAKFVEHLREDGWNPIVLTVEAGPGTPVYDESLEDEVPDGVEVIRAPCPNIEIQVADRIKALIGRSRVKSSPAGPDARQATRNHPRTARFGAGTGGPKDTGIAAFKWVVRNWMEIPTATAPGRTMH